MIPKCYSEDKMTIPMNERHKNVDWLLREPGHGPSGHTYSTTTITLALLMDIRDELQDLNLMLNCPNFMDIPRTLQAIRKNTAKRKTKKRTS